VIKAISILGAVALFAAEAHAACPPSGYDRAALEALKTNDFTIPADERDAFAVALADCLSDPDPFLRDDIGYAALAHLLREGQLSDATRTILLDRLHTQLGAPDEAGFAQPFAALVLSEIVRSDRLAQFIPPEQLNQLAIDAAHYERAVRDYRGFDQREGWRHGIAHGADLLMQLAAHPRVTDAALEGVLEAAGAQISAQDGHFYIYGEGERLARVVLIAARRGEHDEAYWTAWLERHAGAGPLGSWDGAFASQAALARRHNVMAFLTALYINARLGGDDFAALLPGAEAALRTLP